jgi:hypothetical protein
MRIKKMLNEGNIYNILNCVCESSLIPFYYNAGSAQARN